MARTPRETLLGGIVPEILRAADPAGLVAGALGGGAPVGRCRAVAVGKAAAPMIGAAAGALGGRLEGAVVVAPPAADHGPSWARMARAGVEWLPADHPTPTPRNLAAAGRVRELVAGMAPGQTLLVLLSGGASAMLCLPREPLTLGDIASVTDALLRAGAPIGELNAVRKHCEVLKGGGLAAVRGGGGAGRIVSLILSDVLGDRLDVIGSGPTAPDPTTFADALGVLERRGALNASPAATALLRRGAAGAEPETVKPGAPVWARVENRVIGSNRLALDAAVAACDAAGYAVLGRREGVEGEAAAVGRELAAEARRLAAQNDGRRGAILWGGETTVTVGDAPGLGGRNQELALACAIELDGVAGVTVLSFATDGRDGPTDAAGGGGRRLDRRGDPGRGCGGA